MHVLENEIPVVDISVAAGEEIYNALATTGCVIITGSYPKATLNELFQKEPITISSQEMANLCDLHIAFMKTLADKFVKLVGIENLNKENTMSNMTIMECPNDYTNRFHVNPGFFTFTAVNKQCFEIVIDGDIHRVPYIPNSFIVTIGDALSRVSDNVFKAVAHRIDPTLLARSIPFYYDPSSDFLVTEDDQPTITYGEYLRNTI